MKRILIDGTTISSKMDGLSRYILCIVEQLAINHSSKAEFLLLLRLNECPKAYLETYTNAGLTIEYVDIAQIGPKRDIQFARFLKKNRQRFDVFYEPSNQYPVFLQNGVYTIHDLTYELYPAQLGKLSSLKKKWLNYNVQRGLRSSSKVIAVSEYTKSEILRLHNFPGLEEKIEVIYEGWEHVERQDKGLSIRLVSKKYFFYVGSARGHKNLYLLLIAFSKLLESTDVDLVIAGNMDRLGAKERKIIQEINAKQERVFCTGWISDSELSYYFSHCFAFVFPSLSEGFGLPVLEAFYHGVPLLCSINTVFPEICEKAALYFDPFDVDDIAKCLFNFYSNHADLTSTMSYAGKDRLSNFSWKRAGEQIMKLLIDEEKTALVENTDNLQIS